MTSIQTDHIPKCLCFEFKRLIPQEKKKKLWFLEKSKVSSKHGPFNFIIYLLLFENTF